MTQRIGILAGGGGLPVAIAESVLGHGGSVHIVAIDGEAGSEVRRFPHTIVNWGQIGRMVATLKREGGGQMVIAGAVRRPDLLRIRPDLGFVRGVARIMQLVVAGGDDSVLRLVVRFFEEQGLHVLGVDDVAPDLVLGAGPLGRIAPDEAALADARRGFAVTRALGDLDVGQAVAVRGGRIIAIEGAEGTDAMLRRVAAGTPASGRFSGAVTKAPKPGQEMRVDMPAIGPRTVELAAAAGIGTIAVEAGAVLALDRPLLVETADAAGCSVTGLVSEPVQPVATVPVAQIRIAGRCSPEQQVRDDIGIGLEVERRLRPFGAGEAAVVARRHVLAVAAGEGIEDVLARAGGLRQWGDGRRSARRGVLVCRAEAGEPREILRLVCDHRVQGVVAIASGGDAPAWRDAARIADASGTFLGIAEPRP